MQTLSVWKSLKFVVWEWVKKLCSSWLLNMGLASKEITKEKLELTFTQIYKIQSGKTISDTYYVISIFHILNPFPNDKF